MATYLIKYRFYVIAFLITGIIFGLYLIYLPPTNQQPVEKDKIVVDVEGAVKNPGVYNLPSDSRVIDLINKAGGLTKKADNNKVAQEINQSSLLEDEQKVYIPLRNKTSESKSDGQVAATGQEASPGGVVNINQANLDQLDSLPGIGPVYAQRIIDFRDQVGTITSLEQLLNVSGIGPKTLEKIAPNVNL